MKSYIRQGTELLEFWEIKAYELLTDFYTPKIIEQYIEDYRRSPSEFYNRVEQGNGITHSCYSAIRGVSIARGLLEQVQQFIPDKIPMEDAALFAINAFHAGFSIGMACPGTGMEIFKWLHEKESIKAISKKATDVKYSPGRDLYKEALDIAKSKWEKGSPLKHHQMKQYLIKEYQVRGKCPYAKFDPGCGYTEKGLLKRLKELAKEMNRFDLISGQKKSL